MLNRYAPAFVLLLCAGVTHSAEQLWRDSKATLPGLVADGYRVVGFTTDRESSSSMALRENRYLLQKNASVFLCIEKLSPTVGDLNQVRCYELEKPAR
jgi:hypothetical protein